MANASDNYGLILPVDGEFIEINDLNYNFEKIDNVMWDNRRISVAMYNTARTYNTGSLAGHEDANGHIHAYRCLADNVTGTWDATKWTLTDLASEIEDVRENAGTDVEANPSGTATDTLEKLRVDSTIYAIPEDVVSKEAEGNPIEITDGASAPLVKCVSAITGSQDLHGYDKPWVGGAGKNKALVSSDAQDDIRNASVSYSLENGFVLTSTAPYASMRLAFPLTVGETYTVQFRGFSDGNYRRLLFSDNKNDWSSDSYGSVFLTNEDAQYSKTITATSSTFYIIFYPQTSDSGTSMSIYDFMISVGSTVTTFAPYSNICPITAYTEGEIEVRGKNLVKQIVRGYVNSSTNAIRIDDDSETVLIKVEQGEAYTFSAGVTTNRNMIGYVGVDELVNGTPVTNIKTLSSYTWRAEWSGWTAWYINATASADIEATAQVEKGGTPTTYSPYTSTTHTTTFPSAIYRGSEDVVEGEVETEEVVLTLNTATMNNNESYPGWSNSGISDIIGHGISTRFIDVTMNTGSVYAVNTQGTNDTLFLPTDIYGLNQTQWIALALDVQIVVTLATPQISSVTPTNLPIRTLSGYTHIESSTGEMEIEYIISKYQPLVNLMKNMVVANPSEDATATLEKLKVNDTVYSLPSGGGGNTVLAQSLNTLTVTEV